MASLKKRHKEEVAILKSQMSSLEQQLSDARDGDSSGTGGSVSVLPESERAESDVEKTLRSQITVLTQEKEKVSAAKTHLQQVLEELQAEAESLQTQRDEHEAKIAELERSLQSQKEQYQQQIDSLHSQLKEAESWQMEAEASCQQENKLKSRIVEAGTQLQQACADTENLVEHLGDENSQHYVAATMDSLEKENLALKEQNLKFQEQIILLEKRSISQQQEWQRSQSSIRELQQELRQLKDDAGSRSDNTLDQSFTSGTGPKSLSQASRGTDEGAIDREVQKEAVEEVLAQLRQELREKEEQISELSTSEERHCAGEVVSLRKENQRLQSKLSSIQSEKEELETSIGELDEQHEEATNHLIAARNSLQSRLADSQQQVESLQEELKKLSVQQSNLEPASSPNSASSSTDQVDHLRKELQRTKEELVALKQQANSKEAELSDLKAKLQKGTLALNDLHMDKKDLEEALTASREDLKAKVINIKTLRDERAKMAEENKNLAERVQELEDEIESWEQRNEKSQLEKGLQEQLQAQLTDRKSENTAQQQKLDSIFTELDESRTLCRKLERERETLLQQIAAQQMIYGQMEEANQARDKNVDQLSQQQLAALSSQTEKDAKEESVSPNQRTEELQNQLDESKQQVDSLLREKSVLEAEVVRLKGEAFCEDSADIDSLKLHNQQIVRALHQRTVAFSKMKETLDLHSASSVPLKAGEDALVASDPDLTNKTVIELCSENGTLMDALVSGNRVLEEIQQQYCGGTGDSAEVLKPSSASNLQVTPPQGQHLCDSSQDSTTVEAEYQRLLGVIEDNESEILKLKQSLNDLQQKDSDRKQSTDSLSERLLQFETIISEKNSELEILHTENSQLMKMCEESKSKLTESDVKITSLRSQLQETESALQQTQKDLDSARESLKQITEENVLYSEQEKDLGSAKKHIKQLEHELFTIAEAFSAHKTTFEKLQEQYAEQTHCLEMERAKNSKQVDITSDSKTLNTDLRNGDVEIQSVAEQVQHSEKYENMLKQLQEKEDIISDLQQNNTALVQMLEAKSLTSQSGDSSQLEVHRLQSEVKALKVEKEQMLAVMNEKSREASSLKAEVMRLMSVVSAEKSALDKLQKDNQELMSRSTPPRDDTLEDMTREAMQNLSRLVRDREVEIEALKQKNETLMTVLQDMNEGSGGSEGAGVDGTKSGSAIASCLADKENLERQVAVLQSEREQMVVFVNQKHAESTAYHAEIQRLTALRAEENQHLEQLQSDYDKLRPQFEDKNQSLLKTQNDLINYRQKFAELEVRHGELLQKSSASDTVDAISFHEVEAEKEKLFNAKTKLQQEMQDRDVKIAEITEKLKEMENALTNKESEVSSLKKLVDSFHFQLQGMKNETADLRQEKEAAEQRLVEWQEQSQTLKDLNNQFTLGMREKEFEVASLQERIQKMTALVSEQQGEKTQVTQLLRDQEEASSVRAGLQQEVDQLTLAMKQKQQHLTDVHAENLRLKEKEQKLIRELDRLRSHLLQIEEGYTREALEAEEREKGLRNRLAHAEEQLSSTTSQVQSASQQASQQVESLQQQLQHIASQRDAAYMQVANLQEQCQQYASSLSNLQLVLEQFQRDKDSQVASETERYQEQARQLKEQAAKLEQELQQAKVELEEATDGLAAASRLSEQLDGKEEAIQALREEVQHRESALRNAEEEIRKLSANKEAKVDRDLMKNLLLGYFHTPDRNRMDAIHAIGSVLGFTQEDFSKIEESHGGGWVSSLFRRQRTPSATHPSTPIHQPKSPNQSFSQLFVKFLETESTPPPAPVRMPAEEMAREAQIRHHVKERDSRDKPAFNPFTAPRHVSMPIPVGAAATAAASSGSHILMAPPPGSPTTAFPVFTPFSSSDVSPAHNSSAILKDVLGSR